MCITIQISQMVADILHLKWYVSAILDYEKIKFLEHRVYHTKC